MKTLRDFAIYETFDTEPKGMMSFPVTNGGYFATNNCIVAGFIDDLFEVIQVSYINEFSVISNKGETIDLANPLDTYIVFCMAQNKIRIKTINGNNISGLLYNNSTKNPPVDITATVILYPGNDLYIIEVNGHRDYAFLDFSTIDKESLQFQVAECKEELTDFAYTPNCKPENFPN